MKKLSYFVILAIALMFNGFFVPNVNASSFDLNENGVPDSSEIAVVVSTNQQLPAGEYIYNNLIIQNGAKLTLVGDPNSLNSFKGVKITANNITIDLGSTISADETGFDYSIGPGASTIYLAGASYGGVGGYNSATSTYGSAMHPTDLGSSGQGYNPRGGGAIRLVVSGALLNNGQVSADGGSTSSGGSIYITSSAISGSGVFRANGGNPYCPNNCFLAGGGGRIAIYYNSSSFTGDTFVKGGCYSYDSWSISCVESGTVGFINMTTNTLYVNKTWRFEKSDSPINVNHVYLKSGASVKTKEDVTMNFGDLYIEDGSSLTSSKGDVLTSPQINLNNGSLILSGEETINTNFLSLLSGSLLTVVPEKIINLNIPNINISFDSTISADKKGYSYGAGPGAPFEYYSGASYGGVGGGGSPGLTYGSKEKPVDFGSGGFGYNPRGGGVVRLIVSGTLANDGIISANGENTSSGGSVYVTANNLVGSGSFKAGGGTAYCPNTCLGPGGGGRVAIYYQTSTFSGVAQSPGYSGYGGSSTSGTVVMEQSSADCVVGSLSNVLFIPGMMGSRLYKDSDELWVSIDDSKQANMSLDNQGKSINSVYTKNDTQSINDEAETGIIDEALGANIYNSFINDLRNWKTEGIIENYAFIPYDWRLALSDIITNGTTTPDGKLSYTNSQDFSQSFILKKLQELQASSKSCKVTIIAHSNGGLVVKALIQKLKDTNNPLYSQIDKIIFIAVPQVGTPDAIASLLHGTELSWHGFVMNNQRSRQLDENMQTVYNLLPSSNYFTTVDPAFAVDKVVSFPNDPAWQNQLNQYGIYVSNPVELKNYILGSDARVKPNYYDTDSPNIGNQTLYSNAEAVHQILDSWQPASTTKVIQIAGWGEETLAGIDYKKCLDYSVEGFHKCFGLRVVVDGDGTVVVPSALWMSTTLINVERWWINLKNYDSENLVGGNHRNILEIINLRNFIKSKIKNLIFTESDNIVVSTPSSLLSNKPYIHYTLHSPLTLGVVDSQGRYTGLDPITKKLKEEIPGVTFKQIGEIQYISIPENISHTLKLKGYNSGSFSLDVDEQTGNTLTQVTSFQAIPTSTTTSATISYTTGMNLASTTLIVDLNSDNIPDIVLYAKLGQIVIPPKYKWEGYLQPINDTKYHTEQVVSVFRGGSTVPVKFQLKKFDGSLAQSSTSPKWLIPEKLTFMNSPVSESVITSISTLGSDFRYDSTDKQYIYNWSTKGLTVGYWYKISTQLEDGYIYSVIVGLR